MTGYSKKVENIWQGVIIWTLEKQAEKIYQELEKSMSLIIVQIIIRYLKTKFIHLVTQTSHTNKVWLTLKIQYKKA